jgi:hypothetical protein
MRNYFMEHEFRPSHQQNAEEAERLGVYEAWPKISPRIRRAILLVIDAAIEEDLASIEEDNFPSVPGCGLEQQTTPETKTKGIKCN